MIITSYFCFKYIRKNITIQRDNMTSTKNIEKNTNTLTIRLNSEIESRLDFLQNKLQLSKSAIIKLAISRMFESENNGDD